ncbi:hypothetical protein J6590_002661 [Homalodisca vitripennis]|nr:hypothetical protein J6590_002661 [Homalodisca vitripennis]
MPSRFACSTSFAAFGSKSTPRRSDKDVCILRAFRRGGRSYRGVQSQKPPSFSGRFKRYNLQIYEESLPLRSYNPCNFNPSCIQEAPVLWKISTTESS